MQHSSHHKNEYTTQFTPCCSAFNPSIRVMFSAIHLGLSIELQLTILHPHMQSIYIRRRTMQICACAICSFNDLWLVCTSFRFILSACVRAILSNLNVIFEWQSIYGMELHVCCLARKKLSCVSIYRYERIFERFSIDVQVIIECANRSSSK